MTDQPGFEALRDVICERKRQDIKFKEQNHDPFLWMTILGEEFGETCQAALHARFCGNITDDEYQKKLAHLREEAVQTAAVALAMVECLDRKQWRWSTP